MRGKCVLNDVLWMPTRSTAAATDAVAAVLLHSRRKDNERCESSCWVCCSVRAAASVAVRV
jgi:hypothetical protein